jgi:hypothetical protein
VARASPFQAAVAAIDRHGALLVYPIENRPEPASLWRVLHPRTPMRWEWDEGADARVAELWQLRERLARSRKVVYSKWFRGRATFFSHELFVAMLAVYRATGRITRELEPDARELLSVLESDSPLSTKQLRIASGLTGKPFEASYRRGLEQLFQRMLIVGFGEVDDGAFPSLAIGATRALFEELWDEAGTLDHAAASRTIARYLRDGSAFAKYHRKVLAALEKQDEERVELDP